MANRGKTLDPEVFSIKDLKEKASKKLPKMYREYFNEGAMDMITLHDNEAAFDRYRIRPRILRNISKIDTTTEIWGERVLFPFGFSPAAMHRLAHPDGEIGTSRACAALNVAMGLSAYSMDSLEDVIAQGKGKTNPYAMQVSLLKNKDINLQLLQRAEKAGYKAILLTVDAPILGRRLNEYRNSFAMPKGTAYPNIAPGVDMSNLEDASTYAYEDGVNWDEAISYVKSNCNLQIWVKGLYTAEDVATAISYGLDGVVISNHGGRQLDSVPATLDALRECAPVAKGKIKIGIDGGIRRGTDIFKALALGADFCFAGRVPIWGLAYNGTKGVELAIQLLYEEFKLAMGLTGCKSIAEINRGHLSILETNGILSKL
ncbi:FMN-dependent dehydrogenase family protein [Exophiala viscosa]|uniref:Oxidase FUB9 n=1 Tax=Exophiala viscosa TaxID=2486360 RepID=A0AAN6DMG3_9EURO|nr:FMN-dependent dehydrogenase family protein [Exophiala viscosa]KAI1620681.1 FMN-dependent dehydrogenase family protein [Exophiala viscosa]